MSKAVDDRIVSMSFDNSKFDKNVQQSIETIQKLKSNLKFDKTADPFGGLNESAKRIDLSGIERSLDSIKHRFSTTGIIGMTVISNLTTAAMNMAKKSTHWFTQGVVQGGMARAKNIEQAKFQLKGLKVEWDAIYDDIDYAVSGTAYGLDAAAKAASQLVASNVKIGADMKTALRGISGVAAMTNSSYEDISHIFTTVAGNGRLMSDQLNQLASKGLNVAATMAQLKGVTEKELREMVSDGKISFAEFAGYMDEAFGTHAKEANKTLEGALANTRAALGRIGADFIAPFIIENGPLVQFFNRLRNIIDNIRKALIPLEGEFIEPVMNALERAVQWMVNLDHATGSTYRRFTNMLSISDSSRKSVDAFNKSVKNTLASQGIDIDALVDKYGDLGTAIDSLSGKERTGALYDSFVKVGDVLGHSDTSVHRKIYDLDVALEKLTKTYGPLTENNKKAIKALEKEGYSYDALKGQIGNFLKDGYTDFENYTKSELKAIGASKQQILLYRQLSAAAKKAGLSFEDYIDNLAMMEEHGTGGMLILKTLKNAFVALTKPLLAVKDAFFNVFGIKNNEPALYNLIYEIELLSEAFIMSDETAENLRKTFEGIFTVFKWVATIAGGGLRIALYMLAKVLNITGGGLLEMTANISRTVTAIDYGIHRIINNFANMVTGTKAYTASQKALNNVLLPYGRTIKQHTVDNGLLVAIYGYLNNRLDLFAKRVRTAWDAAYKFSHLGEAVEHMKARFVLLERVFNRLFPNFEHHMQVIYGMFNNATFTDKTIDTIIKYINNKVLPELNDPEKWKIIGNMIGEGIRIGFMESSEALLRFAKMFIKTFVEIVKGMLGIHSPSTVFIEIGENIIQGLTIGIKNLTGALIEAIRSVVDSVVNTFNSVNFQKLVALGGAIALFKIISDITNAVSNMLNPLQAATDMFKAFQKIGNELGSTLHKLAKFGPFLIIATAIGELAVALYLLAQLSWEQLAIGLIGISSLCVVLVLLSKALEKVDGAQLSVNMGILIGFISSMAALIAIMGGVVYLLGQVMDRDGLVRGLLGMAAIETMILLMIAVSNEILKDEKAITSSLQMIPLILAFAKAMVLIAASIKLMDSVKPETLTAAIEIMGIIAGVILVATIISGSADSLGGVKDMYDIAAVMVAFGAAIGAVAIAMKIIGSMTPEQYAQATTTLKYIGGLLLGIFGVCAFIGALFGGGKGGNALKLSKTSVVIKDIGGLFVGIGIAFLAISAALKIIATIPEEGLERAINTIKTIGKMIAGFMVLMGIITIFTKGCNAISGMAGVFIGIGVAFIGIATAIKIIGSIKQDNIDKALNAVMAIGYMLMTVMVVARICEKGGGLSMLGVFAGITIALVGITAALVVLSMIDGPSLAKAVVALEFVMAGLAGVLYSTGKMLKYKQALPMMKVITTALIALVAGLVILSVMNPAKVALAALAIVSVLGTLTAVLYMAGKLTKGLPAIIALTVIIVALTYALTLLTQVPTKKAITAGAVVVGALVAFSLLLLAASYFITKASIAMAVIAAVFIGIVLALVAIMKIMQKYKIEANLGFLKSLGKILLVMTACMLLMVPIGLLAGPAITGAGVLAAFTAAIILLMVGLGKLITKFPTIEKFINKGINLLIKMAKGFGQVIGAFVSGMMGTDDMPGIATSISGFVEGLDPFFKTLKSMDGNTIDVAKNLADTVMTFTKLNFTNMPDFDTMAATFEQMGLAMIRFKNVTTEISSEDMDKMKKLTSSLASLMESVDKIPKTDGFAQVLMGVKDVEKFGKDLESLAVGIKSIGDKTAGISDEHIAAIGKIGKAMQEIAKIQPAKTGGLKGFFTGNVKLDKFATTLGELAYGITAFSNGVNSVNLESVEKGVRAGKMLVGMCNAMDIDKKSIKSFDATIGTLGVKIAGFSGHAESLNIEAIDNAVAELKKLVATMNSMAELSGTEAQAFQKNIDTIANTGINEAIESINNSKEALSTAIAGLFDGANTAANSGGAIDFSYKFTESLENSLSIFNAYANSFDMAGKKLATSFSNGFNNSKTSLGGGMKQSIANAIKDVRAYSKQMNSAGAAVSSAFSKGFTSSKSNVNETMRKTLQSCKKVVDDYKSKFQTSGGNLAEGFAKGIALKSYLAENKAKAMAKAAKKAADKALDQHSPSREMMKSGKWFVLGFSKGIERNMEAATSSSALMSTRSMSSVVSAVGTINDTINNGIDPEPRIAPVMDTTTLNRDMNSAMSSINSGYAYDLGANVNVSNHGIDDIASAIATKVKDAIIEAMDRDDDVTININSVLECSGEAIARSSASYMAPELNKLMSRANRRSGNV